MKTTRFERSLRPLTLGLVLGLGGCATTSEFPDPRDPLEGFNRSMYRFNEELDKYLAKPLAEGYQAITPAPVDRGITNFFGNLEDVGSAVNNLLQFKLQRAVSDVGRVLVNSTVGIGGFLDVASGMDMPKYGEDFGQTLGYWGVGDGPYLVLPVLGPSCGRDLVGLAGDWFTDPLNHVSPEGWEYGGKLLRGVDTRADLLGASGVLQQAALDPYEFLKDAYLQKRRSDIYDGNPPPEEDDWDEELDDDPQGEGEGRQVGPQ
jgi:phospholipid-binding lipoprotein MlaA